VLSLRLIIASIAVRSETIPMRFGGSKVGLPNDHTVESSTSAFCPRRLTTSGESAWRSASHST
jgi:hypothetical protein